MSFSLNNLKKYEQDMCNFILQQGEWVMKEKQRNMNTFYHEDQVDVSTNFDKKIEDNFFSYVNKNYPEFGCVGEEHPDWNYEKDLTWMIDPIDGTKYFVHNVPLWGITLSLVDKTGKSLIGIISHPPSGQIIHASFGNKAWVGKKQIFISQEMNLKKLQASFDWSGPIGEQDFTRECFDLFEKTQHSFYRVRMIGSGALSLAWLSMGMYGIFIDPFRSFKKRMDISGGLCIAREAGADIFSTQISPNVTQTFVAHPKVLKEFLKICKK